MTTNNKFARGQGYIVDVNPDAAFSVFYQDGTGRLIFAIEVDDQPKKVYLNPRPSEGGRAVDAHDDATRTRVSLAVDRVKAYFEGQGLTVELD
jgi:hypothetical protein